MQGQGSSGNVIAALASLFFPGLGQLIQGRVLAAIFFLVLACIIWVLTFTTGFWIGHLIACIEAARWKPARVG